MIKVEAENFRSFPFIEWIVPSGLTLLDGANHDTGGSNMAGKCFAKGTPILMYRGTTKLVEQVVRGDLVMGPDSKPRRVLGTTSGIEPLYRVTPVRGEPYIVNESHILTLKWCSTVSSLRKKNQVLNITVKEYLKLPKDQKRLLVGYRAPVDFPVECLFDLKIDPYFLGVWLGDGHSESSSVTTADPEIIECVQFIANQRGLKVLEHGKRGNKAKTYSISSVEHHNNSVLDDLIDYGLIGNKHIPYQYLVSSRENRLSVLAGLMDTDGHLANQHGGSRRSFEYVSCKETLAKDVAFLARSLGFAVSIKKKQKYCVYKHKKRHGDYWVVWIWGHIENIPTRILRKKTNGFSSRKNPLHTGISIEPVGLGEYFGFQVDGDSLFLLGDFTVVHNSTAIDSVFWCKYGWLPKWGGPKGGSADAVVRRKNGEPAGKCWVRVTENIGSDTIIIERSRPSKLVVKKNGEELKGITQDGLDEILGMSAERYLICVYLSQNRNSSFYWMSDAERTDLLSTVANLSGLDRGLEQAKEQKTQAQNEIAKLNGAISVLEPRLVEFCDAKKKNQDALVGLASQILDAEEAVFDVESEFEDLTPVLKETKESLTKERTAPVFSEIAVLRNCITSLNQELAILGQSLEIESKKIEPEYQVAVDEALSAVKEVRNLEKEAQRISSENKRLQDLVVRETELAEAAFSGSCNHCGQALTVEKRQSQAMDHIEKAKQYQAQIKTPPSIPNVDLLLKEYESAASRLAARKSEIDAVPQSIRQNMAVCSETKKAQESKIKELEKEILLIESQIQNEIADALRSKKAEVDAAKSELASLQSDHSRLLRAIADQNSSEKRVIDQISETKKELGRQDFKLNLSLDMIDFFGPRGYRVVAFDGLVRRISDRAGELLSLMTDSLYSTRLESVGQDSKGNQKLILKPVIIKGGIEVPKDDLSGGAETRVALSYDVAVAEAAGNGQPLFLDEVLEGMDSIGKSEAMILLEEVSKSRPVIVVDHTSEFKAQFTQVVKVVYQSEESHLEV